MGRSTGEMFTVHYPKVEGDKTNWPKVGMAFVEEERIIVKLDSLPLPEFWQGGRLALYPSKKNKE